MTIKSEDCITLHLLQPKVGQRIELCVDGAMGFITRFYDFSKTIPTTIIAFDPHDPTQPWCGGWLEGEEVAQFSSLVSGGDSGHPCSIKDIQMVLDIKRYDTFRWFHNSCLVVGASTSISLPVGMTCSARHCNAYVHMAAPNQPDGSFICYQCRQRPSFMR